MNNEDYRAITQIKLSLVETLGDLLEYQLADVYNILCEYTHMEYLFEMDFLDEYFSTSTATYIIESISDRFNTCDSWFAVDDWGFVESYDAPEYFIDLGDMANDLDMYRKEMLEREIPLCVSCLLEELDKIDRS